MKNGVGAIALVVILFNFASPAGAQQRQLGIKAGATIATVVFDPDDDEDDYKRRVGPTFGGFMVWPINERFAAQVEALYVAKGGKVASEIEAAKVTLKLDYFEVPVLARVSVTRSAKRSFYVFAGPSLAIRVNAQLEDALTVDGYTVGNSIDVGSDFERFEFGVVVGGGVDIGEYVVIDGRYVWGLTDVNSRDDVPISIKNRALTFMAGVRF